MENKRDREAKRLADIMKTILQEDNINKQMLEHRTANMWAQIIGPTVAKATKEVYVKDGVLYVSLYSSVIREHLFMLKSKIISSLNDAVGENIIKDVIFK